MESEVTRPFVTVVIASVDDEPRIEACLRSALGQDYPSERLEILVVDAMSMDATREIALRVAAEDERVKLLDNPARTRASALNVALKASRGEIVVPMDPGASYAKTHVSKCVDALAASPAEQLTIVPRLAGRTLLERSLSAVERTRLAFAARSDAAGADALPTLLGAVKRRVFARVGLLDPAMKMEEDVDLSLRIAETGGGVTVRRDIVVHKSEASGFRALFARHYELGRTRARTTVRDRRVRRIDTLAPFAIVVGAAALAVTSTVQPITPLALAAYGLLTGAAAVRVGRREGIATIPMAWAAYPVMHVAHGVGFGAGLVRAIRRPDWAPRESIPAQSGAAAPPDPITAT